jgi:glycosyltransferase involved in cell wall biosynthesis
VNPPHALLPVLGSRGVAESVARAIGRPLLATPLGSIRQTERAAELILAQNRATGRILGKGGKVQLLSNALALEIDSLPASTQPNRQVLFVGQLLGWKALMLALSAFRHVQTLRAVLVFCGRGPELHRLERAVRRWRIEDRVRFEGLLPRERLLFDSRCPPSPGRSRGSRIVYR